ncbi:hypothetical protein RJT34_09244 [Clitoria ternatea]|uniref:mitogen-activated protein kinase kinase kinase n=1 Tax=Clitoria ternatea TaxID=43366 RepID=A0AAN9K742_CLITE
MNDVTDNASVHSFASRVDNALGSPSLADLGVSRVHSFPWQVENAMGSSSLSDLAISQIHNFSWQVDNALGSGRLSDLGISSVHSFAWQVENSMGSSRLSDLAISHIHNFAWQVDNALGSGRLLDLGISHVHSFASQVDYVFGSGRLADFGTSHVHSFASQVDYAIKRSQSFNRTSTSWQKGELLGMGSFGKTYEAINDDGFFFAVKEVPLLDAESQGKLEQEISLLSQLQHDNIVQYYGTDKDNDKLYIFLELVTKGSLARLYQRRRLSNSRVSAYRRQILSGLMYLHDCNVVHRDIMCRNILVHASGSVKLADFGLAKVYELNDVLPYCLGSTLWMAPQVVNRKNNGYGLAVDTWSLGCTVLEMLTRQPPYSELEGVRALFRIGRGEPPHIPQSLSNDAQDFILKCIQVNPDKRPTAAQLLDYPFVKGPLLSRVSPGIETILP